MATSDLDDGYDAFEQFNRSAGMGIVDNPYPMFALVRPEHPMKREDDDDPVIVPEGSDIEFMPMDRSIGASGKFNHTIGLRASATVLAINADASAPIFDAADAGIVGDWRDVLPVLVEQLRAARA